MKQLHKILLTRDTTFEGICDFGENINKWMRLGWRLSGGISASGGLLMQGMIAPDYAPEQYAPSNEPNETEDDK